MAFVAAISAPPINTRAEVDRDIVDSQPVPADLGASDPPSFTPAAASNRLQTNQTNATCGNALSLTLPVRDGDPSDGLTWDVPFNDFANYYPALGGYHPGEDWNLVDGSAAADLNEPVYAIGPGVVEKVSDLGTLGSMVVIRHTGSFVIPRSGNENGRPYSYPREVVGSIYSVYGHLTQVPPFAEGTSCVDSNNIVGRIMDPRPRFGPHLHLEIRHRLAQHSGGSDGTWSLVDPDWNWVRQDGILNGYYEDVQRMVTCNSAVDCSGMRHPRDIIGANSGAVSPLDRALVRADNNSTVYWVQNNKRYRIDSMQVIFSMRGMPGWDGNLITVMPASTVNAIPEGPTFVTHTAESDGLLIREQGTSAVYLVENGRRRRIRNEEALNWMRVDHSDDVIEVTRAVLLGYPLPTEGNNIYALGEGERDLTAKNRFIDAYSRNATDSYCRSNKAVWRGWPGTFSECLRFPLGAVGTAYTSSVSQALGKFQEFGNDSTVYGTVQYNSDTKEAWVVWGAILSTWRDLGYGSSRLGFPTSDEKQCGSNRCTNFEGGYIYWNPATDSTTVVYGATSPPTTPTPSPTPTSPMDNYADLGNPDDEQFHNLRGWGNINPGLLPVGIDSDRTSRYQTLRGDNSVDLSVTRSSGGQRLTFRTEKGFCDDSFDVYVNGQGPLYSFRASSTSEPFPLHTVDVGASAINSDVATVTFRNRARDFCGRAAVYFVRIEPLTGSQPGGPPDISGTWTTDTYLNRKTPACGTRYFPFIPERSYGRMLVEQSDTSLRFRSPIESFALNLTGTITSSGSWAVSGSVTAESVTIEMRFENGTAAADGRTIGSDVVIHIVGTECSALGSFAGTR